MKTIEYAGLIKVLLLAGLLSCNNSEPQAISTMSADVQVSDVEPGMVIASNAREAEKGKPFNSYTEDMQKLVLSYEGVVRNVNLGMSRSEVKGTEKATLVGENKRSVSYKEEISPLEYVDVDYYFDAQDRLDAISLHIFLDNDQAHDDVLFEVNEFFFRKYGKPAINKNHDEIWKPTPNHEIDIMSHVKANMYEVEVEIN